jgi:hypothetical protein
LFESGSAPSWNSSPKRKSRRGSLRQILTNMLYSQPMDSQECAPTQE